MEGVGESITLDVRSKIQFFVPMIVYEKESFVKHGRLSSSDRPRVKSYFFLPPWLLPTGVVQLQQSFYGPRQKAYVGLLFYWLKPSVFLGASGFPARPRLPSPDDPVQLEVLNNLFCIQGLSFLPNDVSQP
jgi:hypothetical protein